MFLLESTGDAAEPLELPYPYARGRTAPGAYTVLPASENSAARAASDSASRALASRRLRLQRYNTKAHTSARMTQAPAAPPTAAATTVWLPELC